MRSKFGRLASLVVLSSGCSSAGGSGGLADGSFTDGPSSIEETASPHPDAAVDDTSASPPSDVVAPPADTPAPPAESGATGPVVTYGTKYTGGQFHLGPVDWDETVWHNACAPGTKYASGIRAAEGTLLAGLWNGIPNVQDYCDACIYVETAKGKSAILRVVTYGDTTPNSIDVSPAASALLDSGEFPRAMTWQFAKCPDTGSVIYEFQTGSSEWWTSLWVRNARVPLSKVAVKSVNHSSFATLSRGTDGTLTDASGFGKGSFTLQLTGVDGKVITETFAWPTGGIAGKTLTGTTNFP